MSPRRLIPLVGLGVLTAGLAAACLPWSVAAPGVADFVGGELAQAYGIAMTAGGPTEIALLPLPRLSFRRVRLSAGAPDGPVLAEGGSLTLQLNLLALLSGRVDVNTLALEGAAITLPTGPDDARWAGPVRRFSERLSPGGAAHPRRFTLSRATVTGCDPRNGRSETARDVDLTVSWPLWSAAADIAGGFTWRGSAARVALAGLRVDSLAAGEASAFSAAATWPAGSASADGTATLGEGLKLIGRGRVQTRSLPETLAWAGSDVALSPFIEALALEGSFETSGKALMLPSVKLRAGSNVLEGAGSMSFGERPLIQATLAAETLNLAPLLLGLIRAFGIDDPADDAEAWRRRPLALDPFTGGDLDLRLSAGSARLGPVLLDEVAAGVIVRAGSIEATLGRASIQGATLKGRIGLNAAADRGETDVRAQGAFERLDLGALLIDLGQYRWVLGGAQGQFAFEGAARTMGALVEHLGGRASVAIDGGAIVGLDLADVLQRKGTVATRSLTGRTGRTVFERAGVTLRFTDGIGEITEGSLKASALTASLLGTISLPERRFQARAELVPPAGTTPDAAARPTVLFEMAGPWDAVSVHAAGRGDGPAPAPDAGSRGGSLLERDSLRVPAAGTAAGLPASIRAHAP